MKLTFSIKCVLREDKIKKNNTCPIYFSVRIGPHTTRIPSGKYVKATDWDQNNNMVRKRDKYMQLLATYLNKKTSGWELYMLEEESLGKPITLSVALKYFKEDTKLSLFDFWKEQLILWQETKEANTIKSYRSTLNIVREFDSKLQFADLTIDKIEKFDLFMRKDRGNTTNGCFTKHKCLKRIIRIAIMKGFMKENPYQYFPIKSTPGNRLSLSIEEINKLREFAIPSSNGFLNRVRDLFLFSCYTGLRYSDVQNLKWANVKQAPDRLEIEIVKTNKQLIIPLGKNALGILMKYSKLKIKTSDQKVLPKMSNQVINRELKVLMTEAKIDKQISFHCARHSFASNHLEAGTSIMVVKDFMGHTSLKDTLLYSKNLASNLYDSMNKLDELYSYVS